MTLFNPMSTAPKDGTAFLAKLEYKGEYNNQVYWSGYGIIEWDNEYKQWILGAEGYALEEKDCLGWLPIPEFTGVGDV